jgi:hypothetical protein
LGEYLPDGRYAVDVIAKDKVGNDTIVSDPLGGGKDTLYVDRTRPQIYQVVCVPWVVDEDNITTLRFTLSEEDDKEVNRNGVMAIITVNDSIIVDTVEMFVDSCTYYVEVDLTNFGDGTHRIGVKATDWCGNIKTAMATTVKGTIGAMFTMPADGDTLPRGYVTLKGFAADPDMGNHYGFEKYEIYYRTHSGKDTRDKSRYSPERGVPTGWKSAGIEVPPNMREPGGPLNRSIVEVTQNSTLAYWNTQVAGTGFFDLLLVSTEKQTGNTLADTITVNIGIEEVTNPSVSIDSVFPSPFHTDSNSILTIECNLEHKAGNVSVDIVNPGNEVVFHNKHYNVIPYEGTPSGKSEFGFYFYKEDTNWYIYWSNPDTTLPASFTGTIEGIDSGVFNVIDTTELGEDASYTMAWNTIDFSAISQGSLNGLGFTSTFTRIQLTLTVNGISSEEYVFLGASKAKASVMPFVVEEKKDFHWDGRKQNGAVVGSGLYKIIATAEGYDGTGRGTDTDSVQVFSVFEVDTIYRDPNVLIPNYGDTLFPGIPVTLFYKLNRDAYVSVDIYKGDDSLTTIQKDKFIPGTGNFVHEISWDGRYGNNIAEEGTDYWFLLRAISSDSLDVLSDSSEFFSVVDSIPVVTGDFFIPDRYYEGSLHSDSVFNGKNEFLWDATAEGEYFPPQDFEYEVKRGGFKFRKVIWKVEACWDTAVVDTDYIYQGLPVYNGSTKSVWPVPDSVKEGDKIKVKDYYGDWISFTYDPLFWGYTQYIWYCPDPPGYISFLAGADTLDSLPGIGGPVLGGFPDSSSFYALDLKVPLWRTVTFIQDSTKDTVRQYATAEHTLLGEYSYATKQYYRCFATVDNHEEMVSTESGTDSVTLIHNGVSTIFGCDRPHVNIYVVVDPDTSYSKWDSIISRVDTCFVNTTNWVYDTVELKLDNIFIINTDSVAQSTVWDSIKKTGGSDSVAVSLVYSQGFAYVKGEVEGWNSFWSSAMDPLFPNGILLGDSASAFITDYFNTSGLRETPTIFSKYYAKGISRRVNWKVTLHGEKEVTDTSYILHADSEVVFRAPESTDIEFYNPYSHHGTLSFYGEKGHPYVQVQKYGAEWYIWDDSTSQFVTDSLGTGAYKNIKAWCTHTEYWSESMNGHFTVAKDMVEDLWYINPDDYTVTEYVYKVTVGDTSEEKITTIPQAVTFSLNGVKVLFKKPTGPHPYSIYGYLGGNNPKGTFWAQGDSSNPFLNIENWDVNAYYLDGSPNQDLTVDSDSAYIREPLIYPHGFGQGAQDYFKPFLLLRRENPKQYLEIDGKSGEKYYKFFYFDGEDIRPITDSMMNPISDSGALAYWDVASVCGNEQVIMMLYSNADTTIPDTIKVRNFYIGDLFQPSTGKLLAHSSYFRAQLHFDENSFDDDTLTKISPFSLAEVEDPRVPLVGGNYNPVVMMQPFGARFPDSARPTLLFKYTWDEFIVFEIDTSDLRIFAISDEGELEYITSYATLDQDSVLIITASPNNFPGEGKHPYFSTLNITETDTIRPEITKSYLINDSTSFISGYAAPSVPLRIISTDPMENIYDVIEAMGGGREGGRGGGRGGEIVDQVVVIPNSEGYFETSELNVASGRNVVFVANDEAVGYYYTQQQQRGGEVMIKNCPVGYATFVVDTTFPKLLLVSDSIPVIEEYFDKDSLRFFLTKNGRILYKRYDLYGTSEEIKEWFVAESETVTVVWEGRDSLNNAVPNGHYQYQLVAFDKQGHKADEIWSYWDLRRKLNVVIYLPQDGAWLNKTVKLHAGIEEEVDFPLYWDVLCYEGGMWENIGIQPSVYDTIPWYTVYTDDGRNVLLRVWAEDPVEIRGEDTIRVNLDNTAPVTSLSIGEPKYYPEGVDLGYVTSTTEFSLSAYDSIIGVDKTFYAIDDPSQDSVYTTPFTITKTDGIHHVYYHSIDLLGNLENQRYQKIFLDNTPPLLTVTFGRPHYIYQNNIYITSSTDVNLNISDDGCGTSSSIYNIDNGPWVTYEEDTSFRLSTQSDGYHYVHCKNIDYLGNSKTYSIELSVDNTKPESKMTVGEPKYIHPETNRVYLTSRTPISISSQDPEVNQVSSGVDVSLYRINGGQWIEYEGEFTLVGNDGEYQIEYYSRDNVENTETINKIKLTLDNTPPKPPQNLTATIIPGTANVPGISGEITYDTYWSGNVLVSGDVHVREGVTLTIERGTNIRFSALQDDQRSGEDTTRAELIVDGRIVAEGSSQDSIRFTSIVYGQVQLDWLEGPEWDLNEYKLYRRTDTTHFVVIDSVPHPETTYTDTTVFHGEDYYYVARAVDFLGNESSASNEDSVLPREQEPGDWYGIEIDQMSSLFKSIFDHCIIKYGRLGILCNPASPEIRNSLFAYDYEISTAGVIPSAAIVGLNGSSPDISNNTILLIPRRSFGILLNNSKMNIINNTIKSSESEKRLKPKNFREILITQSRGDTSILDTLDAGIRLSNCSGEVVRNTLTSTGFVGIIVLGGKNITIEGNEINTDEQMLSGISTRRSERTTIERNKIRAVDGSGSSEGIYFEQCDSTVVVKGNEIRDTRISGISYRNSSSIVIENEIVNNNRYGIANVKEGGELIVSKNLVMGNMYGVYIEHTVTTPNLGNLHNRTNIDDGGNRIYLNLERDVYNGSSSKVMAHNNCWGSVDSLTIDTLLIYDDDENPSCGLVDYSYFSSPDIILSIGEPKYGTDPVYVTSSSDFSLSIEDTGYCSSIESMEFKKDENPWLPYTDSFHVVMEGYHIIHYRGIDYMGKPVKEDSVDVAVDETPPKSELLVGEPQYTSGTKVYVSSKTPLSIFAEDPVVNDVASGLKETLYRIIYEGMNVEFDSSPLNWKNKTEELDISNPFMMDNGEISSAKGIAEEKRSLSKDYAGDWQVYTDTFYLEGEDGTYKIEYYSVDNLGNEEDIRTTLLILDNTSPMVNMEVGEPQYVDINSEIIYVTDETEFTLSGNDGEGSGLAYLEYLIDLGSWITYDSSFSILNEGLHNLSYRGADNVENVSETQMRSVAVDLTPPVSEIIPGKPHYVFGNNDSILVSSETAITINSHDSIASNVASGVEILTYRINEGPWGIITDSTVVFSLFGEESRYTVDYGAIDHVKNQEQINTQLFLLNDSIPLARILSPVDSTLINGKVFIIGTAWHQYFGWYRVEYGRGADPNEWVVIKPETNTPVVKDILSEWNTSGLANGIYTIRLLATDLLNRISEDRVIIAIGEPNFVFEIPGLSKPEGVEIDRFDNIYVANTQFRELLKFDPFANQLLCIDVGERTNDVAIDLQGNIYTTVYSSKALKFDREGNLLKEFLGLHHPKGITLDSINTGNRNSNIYITDTKKNRVVKLDADGMLLLQISGGLLHPEGMAVDESLNIFICNTVRNTIRKYSPKGNLVLEFGEHGSSPGQFKFPSAVDIDKNGNIIVADKGNDRIQVFDRWGNPIMQFGERGSKPGKFKHPEGIALDSQGNIFVADMNNDRIQKFSIPYFGGDRTMEMLTSGDDVKLEITEAVNVPNPFNPVRENTRIRVVLSKYADVTVLIYTLTGKLVHKEEFPGMEGINEVVWDGRNYLGELVNNGVYGLVVKAKSGDEQARRFNKIAVVK